MILNGSLNTLWFNTDIALCGGGAAMLQEPLNKGNVIATVLVDLCGIPFAEAVGTDTLIAQVIADNVQLLLDRALSNGKDDVRSSDTVAQAVIFNVLVKHQRDSEDPALASLLLHDLQPIPLSITDNVALPEAQHITDPQSQVPLQNQCCSDPFIGSAAGETFSHGLDDLFVLFRGQRFCFLIHSLLPL